MYIATTLILGFAAVNTGNNLLYLIISLLLGFMSTSGLLGWLNIRGIDCTLSVSDEIYSNAPTLVTLTISNRKPFMHSYLLTIALLGQKALITHVPRGATATTSFIQTFNGRGIHTVDSFIVNSPFPVNFFVRGMEVPVSEQIIVFPNPVATGYNPFTRSDSGGGEFQRTRRGSDGELFGIADYTGTEPLRQIHWRLSARHDWFKVKESAATADEPVLLDLGADSSTPLEEKLSRASFLINSLSRRNRKVGLQLSAQKSIPPGSGVTHRLRLLKELALFS